MQRKPEVQSPRYSTQITADRQRTAHAVHEAPAPDCAVHAVTRDRRTPSPPPRPHRSSSSPPQRSRCTPEPRAPIYIVCRMHHAACTVGSHQVQRATSYRHCVEVEKGPRSAMQRTCSAHVHAHAHVHVARGSIRLGGFGTRHLVRQ